MDAPIAIAVLALIGSVVSTILTAYFSRGRQRAAGLLDRYAALQTNFETLDSLIGTLRRELEKESRCRQVLEKKLGIEKLARQEAETRIEQLSDRLDKADQLTRSLEKDLGRERRARQTAEKKLDGFTDRLEALTLENADLRRSTGSL